MEYKISKFTIIDLIIIALFSAATFLTTFIAYSFATTNPLGSGIVLFFTVAFFAILVASLVQKFGSITLYGIIFGILILPTPITGLPGPLKFLAFIPTTLVSDFVFYMLRKKELIASISAAITAVLVYLSFLILVLYYLGMPYAQILLGALLFVYGLAFIEAIAGAVVAYFVYKKIKNKSLIKRIRSWK